MKLLATTVAALSLAMTALGSPADDLGAKFESAIENQENKMFAEHLKLRANYVKALKKLEAKFKKSLKTTQDLDDYNALIKEISSMDTFSGKATDLSKVSNTSIKRLRKLYDDESAKLVNDHTKAVGLITEKMVNILQNMEMDAIRAGNVSLASEAKDLRIKLKAPEVNAVEEAPGKGQVFRIQDSNSSYTHARLGQVISFEAGKKYTVRIEAKVDSGTLGSNGDLFPELIDPSINWFEGEEHRKWEETKATIKTEIKERGGWNAITTTFEAKHDQKARLQFAFYQDKGVCFRNLSLKSIDGVEILKDTERLKGWSNKDSLSIVKPNQ